MVVPNFGPASVTQVANLDHSIDYLATFRARLGFLATQRLLFYITGGLAYGGVHASTELTDTVFANGGRAMSSAPINGSVTEPQAGWVAGCGLEWMFNCHWSAKLEYLHYDLGDKSYFLAPLVINAPPVAVPATVNIVQSTASFEGEIVRAGLNFHF
jgi:outer membrane immunogenic protein